MAPPFRVYEGKLAIVTGASRSFGAACAEHFASRGANVVINYATEGSTAKAQALAKDFESKYNVKALTVQADLSKAEGPQQVVDAAKGHFAKDGGRFQIDIIVNNAATVNGQRLDELDLDLFQQTFDLNCRAPALLIKAAATTTWGVFGQTSYAGTKGAIEAMTRVWARELAERATVNAVSPGPMDTGLYSTLPEEIKETLKPQNNLTPLAATREGVDTPQMLTLAKEIGGRPGYLEEVAGIVGICCLPESGWMTGNQVSASGGGHFVR
ncbi:3-oxoacyl-reductase [Apiospora arundinis]